VKLYKRGVFDKIERFIGDETIIVLHGARQVGKTHILFYLRDWLTEKGKKVFFYDLEYPNLLADLNRGVEFFLADLEGRGYEAPEEIYVLIDEIQYLDNPSSLLKIIADHHKNIHLIVSGSSSFDIKTKFTDSLAGRTIPFEIYPLSFEEYLTFKEVEYALPVVNPAAISRIKDLYYDFIKYGGYPKVVLEPLEEKKKGYLLQIIDTYIRKDVRDLAKVEDLDKFNRMLKVLSAQSGQILEMASLSRETGISLPTLQKYLSILEETYVIKRVFPFSRHPSVEISKNPKVFFFDSGLQSVLWLGEFQGAALGSVLETNFYGELVKRFGRQVIYFWRTKAHQEIDFVIQKENNQVLPIEVKTNFQQANHRTMKSFAKKYGVVDWKVVALEGEKKPPHDNYPWEI